MIVPHFIKIFSIAMLIGYLVSSVEPKKNKCPSLAKTNRYDRERKHYYIIMFKKQDNHRSSSIENHFEIMETCWNKHVKHVTPNGHKSSNDMNTLMDFSVKGYIHGYCGHFTQSFVDEQLSKMSDIDIIEMDGPVSINRAIPQNLTRTVVRNPTKNIDRIDQARRPLDRKFIFPSSAGEGTNIFVIDSGIRITHKEFGNRARFGASFCENCNDQDENGHGTQVASIAAGRTFGVARKANLVAVRVLNANGDGTKADIINGMSFVLSEHNKSQNKNSIINMSINGLLSDAVNKIVQDLTDAGIHFVVAAGNDATDACNSSPSSAPSAITVGATEENNEQIADFSNTGTCLDIFAPGVNIKGAGNESDTDVLILSGTSQATPHVAGTIALMISKDGNKSPNLMATELKNLSTKNTIKGFKKGSPDSFIRTPAP